jgi:ribonuclease BN (tRNA processing enzyme)
MFELLMHGVGDAFSRRFWGTSFLVRKDDFILAVDCPDAYMRGLHDHAFPHKERALGPEDIDAMILTHLHGDHVNGLEMLACYRRFSGSGKLTLYTTPEARADLWPRRLAASIGVLWEGHTFHTQSEADFFDMHELDWQKPIQIGPFSVQIHPTRHHIPTAALRISDGTHTLGHSCDTTFYPELIDWLADADLILHETNLGPAHTQLADLLDLPQTLRDKMLLVHYPDELAGADLSIQLAQQGARYQVGAASSLT